ncbi:unnamed protein product [Paramecium sonneborni]|uniref:Uncharacterized protein n=1 Tax=Paramecium sonneborni TaxID=65129 RepID=A0A8S1LBM3_9CILI|nr:unnamed protein product [Paramecium sonneborni]
MGCTSQKQSSPPKSRNDESITTGQLDSKFTQNIITLKYSNQKLIGQKIKSGKYYNLLLNHVILQKDILNSTIMIRRQKNQENLPSKKDYVTSSNGCN